MISSAFENFCDDSWWYDNYYVDETTYGEDSWWTDGWWDYDAQAAQEPDHPGLGEKLQEAQQAE